MHFSTTFCDQASNAIIKPVKVWRRAQAEVVIVLLYMI